jgi:hypothetical protein
MTSIIATFEPLRTVAFGGISTAYAPVGTPFANPIRLMKIVNNTAGDLLFSIDGVNDYIFQPAGSGTIYDICTNHEQDLAFYFPVGTQIYVKQSTAPTSGACYVEAVYGR